MKIEELSVLLIDDDVFIVETMKASLKSLGIINVSTYSDSDQILHLLQNSCQNYDVILTDLNMPVVDGLTILRALNEQSYQGGVILVSGEDRRILNAATTLASALNLNLLGAISKPITRNTLEGLLLKVIQKGVEVAQRRAFPKVTEEDLREGILNDELSVYYQPKVWTKDKSIKGAEALVRWESSKHGFLPPDSFIPLSEQTGQVNDILEVVSKKAMTQAGKWNRQGHAFQIAINVSVSSLNRLDLPEFLDEIARNSGLSSDKVVFEVTESEIMSKIHRPLEVLSRLAMMGYQLSVDDFGTGHSSMIKLVTFPFNELKIDRAFVNGVGSDEIARAILEASTILGQKLNMSVVAEGVEDQSDWDVVVKSGVDVVQGYFIAKPMPSTEFEQWMESWSILLEKEGSL